MITALNINSYNPSLEVKNTSKTEFGEVRTPATVVNKILDLFPKMIFSNPTKTWLDVGAGTGQFSIQLFKRFDENLSGIIPDQIKRHHHILTRMLFMVEIQSEHIKELRKMFGEKANIWEADFIHDPLQKSTFDCVIGNPPFNSNGIKKVPTNTTVSKRFDGNTIWTEFVKKGMDYVQDSGYVAMITPTLWMHQDKAKIHNLLTSNKLLYISCYSSTQTNTIFKKQAQTPTCYFLVKKTNPDCTTYIFDPGRKEYIRFPIRPEYPLPVFGASVISKLIPFVTAFGYMKSTISKSPPKNTTFSLQKNSNHTYPVIRTCILNKLQPQLTIEYSNVPMPFYNIPKVILAHKMYGFPFMDVSGTYGVTYRDNHIITVNSRENQKNKTRILRVNLQKIVAFLSTKLALYIFEATRYRMRYLERYVFQLIPDITKLPNFPKLITDHSLATYFNLDETDIQAIRSLHKKKYKKTILPK